MILSADTSARTPSLASAQSPLFEKLIENEKNDFAHFLDALTVILPVPGRRDAI